MSNIEIVKQEIKELSIVDLIDLYLEAKAGKYFNAIDNLPVEIVDLIEALDEAVKELDFN